MINKFSKILEAKGNIYQVGTPFSNGHRSRKNKDGFLLDHHLMIDIDKLVVDKNDRIVGIIEKKAQLPGPGSPFKNILDKNVYSPQKMALLELTKRLGCKLFIQVESELSYYLLKQDFSFKKYEESIMDKSIKDNSYNVIETDNLIFIEFRYQYGRVLIKAIAERVPSNVITFKYLNQISEACGGIFTFQVDDSSRVITFRKSGKLIGSVDSVLYPKNIDDLQRVKLENQWEEIYKKMDLWD